MKLNKFISALVCFIASFQAFADIKLPALFSDNMMLQQQMDTPIWGWAAKNERLSITTSWDSKTYEVKADKQGNWKTTIKTPVAGFNVYEISIQQALEVITIKNVIIGEVWLCSGQSNMEMSLKGYPGQPVLGGNEAILKSKTSQIRFITVPRSGTLTPNTNFQGRWEEANPKTTAGFSATAWFYGRLLQEVLQVPVGLIHVSYGGSNIEAWMNTEMLRDFKTIEIPKKIEALKKDPNRKATALYNGMLSPVIGYGIKGCIWYQGESNYDRPFQYQELFKKMVSEWRALWNQGDFPFYYAQIAPFDYATFHPNDIIERNNSAYLRESQHKAFKEIPNSGMAVLMDVGQETGIHPMKKKVVGERLAYLALGKTYGVEGFEYASPEFKAMEINGSVVTIAFDNVATGMTSYLKEVKGFEIAGENQVFYPAQVQLRAKSILVSSPSVEKPVAVRYLFKNYAEAELFNGAGLPLSSFRTDSWPVSD